MSEDKVVDLDEKRAEREVRKILADEAERLMRNRRNMDTSNKNMDKILRVRGRDRN